METKNIMIVGVGGQGTLLASKLLGAVLLEKDYDVKVSEVHGMSQRGGSVVTYVRFGEKVYSPIIDKGEADIILSFELLEAARWLEYLKPGGQMIVNTQRMEPMPVIIGAAEYPEDILNELKETARSPDFYNYLHKRINEHLMEQQTGNAKPYVFVYGIGSMFPYLRANVFLTCMEQFNQVNQYKMILFYPGESKGNSYSLFSQLEDMHAYRGTLLNYTE